MQKDLFEVERIILIAYGIFAGSISFGY